MGVLGHDGPFRPGTGAPPPYLAGRGREQGLFRGLIEDLLAGVPPPSEVILYGPRGNGKTVLLRWLELEARRFSGLETLWKTPSAISDRARLAEALLPETWWRRYGPDEVEVGDTTWRPGKGPPPSPEVVLETRARKAAFVLLLDEAHTLDPEVGRELLNASQEVGRELPFLLVLAGTPNLRSRLNRMGASFWNRAQLVRVGRLSEAAAAAALERPFAEHGVAMDEDALEAMVSASQCYPFFVQVLGRAVWRQVEGRGLGGRRVTGPTLDRARPGFEEVKGEYYLHRFEELENRGLLPVGRAVAEAFRDSARVGGPELRSAIEAGLGDGATPEAVNAATGTLSDLGFIWRVRARPEWEPGIPSLMDYIREFAPPPSPRRKPHLRSRGDGVS